MSKTKKTKFDKQLGSAIPIPSEGARERASLSMGPSHLLILSILTILPFTSIALFSGSTEGISDKTQRPSPCDV